MILVNDQLKNYLNITTILTNKND